MARTTIQDGVVAHTSYKRGQQPKCENRFKDGRRTKTCNHSLSFHGGEDHGPCRALGCLCDGWKNSKA